MTAVSLVCQLAFLVLLGATTGSMYKFQVEFSYRRTEDVGFLTLPATYIPDGQCTGAFDLSLFTYLLCEYPVALNLVVKDFAMPDLQIDPSLSSAVIKRSKDCSGPALVTARVACTLDTTSEELLG